VILEKLKAGTDNVREVPFFGASLRLRVLSEAQNLQARAAAQGKDRDEEAYFVEVALRQLYAALSDQDGNPVADNFESFRKLVTRSEREYLIAAYLELEHDCSPSLDTMSAEEFEQVMAAVKKSPDSILNASNIVLLRRLVRYLESRR
jgi:hypothetical protein